MSFYTTQFIPRPYPDIQHISTWSPPFVEQVILRWRPEIIFKIIMCIQLRPKLKIIFEHIYSRIEAKHSRSTMFLIFTFPCTIGCTAPNLGNTKYCSSCIPTSMYCQLIAYPSTVGNRRKWNRHCSYPWYLNHWSSQIDSNCVFIF